MKKKSFRRFLALVLTLFTVVAALPLGVFADTLNAYWATLGAESKDTGNPNVTEATVTLTVDAEALAEILREKGLSLGAITSGIQFSADEIFKIISMEEILEIVEPEELLDIIDPDEIIDKLGLDQLMGYVEDVDAIVNVIGSENLTKLFDMELVIKELGKKYGADELTAMDKGIEVLAEYLTPHADDLIGDDLSKLGLNYNELLAAFDTNGDGNGYDEIQQYLNFSEIVDVVGFKNMLDAVTDKKQFIEELGGLKALVDAGLFKIDALVKDVSFADLKLILALEDNELSGMIADYDGLVEEMSEIVGLTNYVHVSELLKDKADLLTPGEKEIIKNHLLNNSEFLDDIQSPESTLLKKDVLANILQGMDYDKLSSFVDVETLFRDNISSFQDLLDSAKIQDLFVDGTLDLDAAALYNKLEELHYDVSSLEDLLTDGLDVEAIYNKLKELNYNVSSLEDLLTENLDAEALYDKLKELNYDVTSLEGLLAEEPVNTEAVLEEAKVILAGYGNGEGMIAFLFDYGFISLDDPADTEAALNEVKTILAGYDEGRGMIAFLFDQGFVSIEDPADAEAALNEIKTILAGYEDGKGMIAFLFDYNFVSMEQVKGLVTNGTVSMDEIVTDQNALESTLIGIVNGMDAATLYGYVTDIVGLAQTFTYDQAISAINGGVAKIVEDYVVLSELVGEGDGKISVHAVLDRLGEGEQEEYIDVAKLFADGKINISDLLAKSILDTTKFWEKANGAVEGLLANNRFNENLQAEVKKWTQVQYEKLNGLGLGTAVTKPHRIDAITGLDGFTDTVLKQMKASDDKTFTNKLYRAVFSQLLKRDPATDSTISALYQKAMKHLLNVTDATFKNNLNKVIADNLSIGKLREMGLMDGVMNAVVNQLSSSEVAEIVSAIGIENYIRPIAEMLIPRVWGSIDGVTVDGYAVITEDEDGTKVMDPKALIQAIDGILPKLEDIAALDNNAEPIISTTVSVDYTTGKISEDTYKERTKAITFNVLLTGDITQLKDIAGKVSSIIKKFIPKFEFDGENFNLELNIPDELSKIYAAALNNDQLDAELKVKLMQLTDGSVIGFAEALTLDDLVKLLDSVEPSAIYKQVTAQSNMQALLQKLENKTGYAFTAMSLDDIIDQLGTLPTFDRFLDAFKSKFGKDVSGYVDTIVDKGDAVLDNGKLQSIIAKVEARFNLNLSSLSLNDIVERAKVVSTSQAVAEAVSDAIGKDITDKLNRLTGDEVGIDQLYEQALAKINTLSSQYETAKNVILSKAELLPTGLLKTSVASLYQGNGVFAKSGSFEYDLKGTVLKAAEKLLGRVSLGSLDSKTVLDYLKGLLGESGEPMKFNADITVNFGGLYRINYYGREAIDDPDAKPLFSAFLPAGTNLSIYKDAPEVTGYVFHSWGCKNESGKLVDIEKMPSRDIDVYADITKVKLDFVNKDLVTDEETLLGSILVDRGSTFESLYTTYKAQLDAIVKKINDAGMLDMPKEDWDKYEKKMLLEWRYGTEVFSETNYADFTTAFNGDGKIYFAPKAVRLPDVTTATVTFMVKNNSAAVWSYQIVVSKGATYADFFEGAYKSDYELMLADLETKGYLTGDGVYIEKYLATWQNTAAGETFGADTYQNFTTTLTADTELVLKKVEVKREVTVEFYAQDGTTKLDSIKVVAGTTYKQFYSTGVHRAFMAALEQAVKDGGYLNVPAGKIYVDRYDIQWKFKDDIFSDTELDFTTEFLGADDDTDKVVLEPKEVLKQVVLKFVTDNNVQLGTFTVDAGTSYKDLYDSAKYLSKMQELESSAKVQNLLVAEDSALMNSYTLWWKRGNDEFNKNSNLAAFAYKFNVNKSGDSVDITFAKTPNYKYIKLIFVDPTGTELFRIEKHANGDKIKAGLTFAELYSQFPTVMSQEEAKLKTGEFLTIPENQKLYIERIDLKWKYGTDLFSTDSASATKRFVGDAYGNSTITLAPQTVRYKINVSFYAPDGTTLLDKITVEGGSDYSAFYTGGAYKAQMDAVVQKLTAAGYLKPTYQDSFHITHYTTAWTRGEDLFSDSNYVFDYKFNKNELTVKIVLTPQAVYQELIEFESADDSIEYVITREDDGTLVLIMDEDADRVGSYSVRLHTVIANAIIENSTAGFRLEHGDYSFAIPNAILRRFSTLLGDKLAESGIKLEDKEHGNAVPETFKNTIYDNGSSNTFFYTYNVSVDASKLPDGVTAADFNDFDGNKIEITVPYQYEVGRDPNLVTNVYAMVPKKDAPGEYERELIAYNLAPDAANHITFATAHFTDFASTSEYVVTFGSYITEFGYYKRLADATYGFADELVAGSVNKNSALLMKVAPGVTIPANTTLLPAGTTFTFNMADFDYPVGFIPEKAVIFHADGTTTEYAIGETVTVTGDMRLMSVVFSEPQYHIYYYVNGELVHTLNYEAYQTAEYLKDQGLLLTPEQLITLAGEKDIAAPEHYLSAGVLKGYNADKVGVENMVITLTWNPVQYKIIFKDAAGNVLADSGDKLYTADEIKALAYVLPTIEKDGVITKLALDGSVADAAYDAAEKTAVVTVVTSTHSFTYQVNTDNNVTAAPETGEVGTVITVTPAQRPGYTATVVVVDSANKQLAVTVGETITFEMPASNVFVSVVYTANTLTYKVDGKEYEAEYGKTVTLPDITVPAGKKLVFAKDYEGLTLLSVTEGEDGSKIYRYAIKLTGDVDIAYELEDIKSTQIIFQIVNGMLFDGDKDPVSSLKNVTFAGWSETVAGSLQFATFVLEQVAPSLLWLWILLGVLLFCAIIALIYMLHINGKLGASFLTRFACWLIDIFFAVCRAFAWVVLKIAGLFGFSTKQEHYGFERNVTFDDGLAEAEAEKAAAQSQISYTVVVETPAEEASGEEISEDNDDAVEAAVVAETVEEIAEDAVAEEATEEEAPAEEVAEEAPAAEPVEGEIPLVEESEEAPAEETTEEEAPAEEATEEEAPAEEATEEEAPAEEATEEEAPAEEVTEEEAPAEEVTEEEAPAEEATEEEVPAEEATEEEAPAEEVTEEEAPVEEATEEEAPVEEATEEDSEEEKKENQ